MTLALRLLVFSATLVAIALPAVADDRQTQSTGDQPAATTETAPAPSPVAPTMKDLLSTGYEVKAVTIVPHDIVKRGGSTTDVDAVMITLQKGAALATCYTEFTSFANGAFVTLACTEFK